MIWTQATNESIFRLTFPAPRFWPSPTFWSCTSWKCRIYGRLALLPRLCELPSPCTRGNLMSRTELEGSECNHGSGCGRSGSSASKLGTYRTLSLNSYKKYSRSAFFFLSLCAAVNTSKAKHWKLREPSLPQHTHFLDVWVIEGSAYLFLLTFVWWLL